MTSVTLSPPSLARWPLLSLTAMVLAGCFGSNDDPTPVMQDGRIVGIQNCSQPREEHALRCRALICQRTLYERKLLPANVEIVKSSHSHAFSDSPTKSIHVIKYRDGKAYRYPMCEMRGQDVVRTDEFSAQGQDW